MRRADRLGVALALAAAVVLGGCGASERATDEASRQREVKRRGRDVMPFDLDATTHRFRPTGDGLVQVVVADPPAPDDQVRLVRSHLRAEARRFTAGDFDDPAAIHGHDMPGLRVLRARAAALHVSYQNVVDGGRITYRSEDPVVVAALHRWAEAQVTDHGDHAEHG